MALKSVRCTDGHGVRLVVNDCGEVGRTMLRYLDNPPALSTGHAASLGDVTGRWCVAHTKARFEKAFAFDLLRLDVPYFLPLVQRTRFSGGRNRRVLLPLFNSYVFFCGDDQSASLALATGRLCQVIPVADQPRFVREISAIEQALRSGADLSPYPGVAIGRRYRVTAGPLEHLEGIVVRPASIARFVLDVNLLGQGALVEIDADLLEPIGTSAPALLSTSAAR